MAMITYDNKSTLNPQPSVADANKVTSGDMNMIKSVVNTNYGEVGDINNLNTTDKTSIVNAINETIVNYETDTEIPLNEYLDGKRVYARVYEGNVPSSASSSSTNIIDLTNLNLDKVWLDESRSYFFITSNNSVLGINWYYTTSDYCRTFIYGGSNVSMRIGTESTLNTYHIVIKYTKASN